MKINEIIKEKRKQRSLTQEQVAEYLGVSTPAVNKWEQGVNYPDITLLPALARLLQTDLNTLLSFDDDLTEVEINNFTNYIQQAMQADGYEAGFAAAMQKIHEYPSCDWLICILALTLDGGLSLFSVANKDQYQEELSKLYLRLLISEQEEIRCQALNRLIAQYMQQEDYERAQEMIDSLPHTLSAQGTHQAMLYLKQNRLDEAAELIEGRLLIAVLDIHAHLMTLMEIASKEDRLADAQCLADIAYQTNQLFALSSYTAYIHQFELATSQREADKCLELLALMLPAIGEKWDLNASPLYRHLQKAPEEHSDDFLTQSLLKELQSNDKYAFLHEYAEFQQLLAQHSETPICMSQSDS